MSEKLDWVFEGVDHFSGPVGSMASGLVGFSLGLNSATDLVAKLAEGISYLGEKAAAFTEFGLDAVSFKESTLVMYQTILGTKKEAAALFNKAQQMADLSPFETKDVVQGFASMLNAHLGKEEIPIVMQGVMDMASFSTDANEMKQTMATVTNDIAAMLTNNQVDAHHLRSMMIATHGIVNKESLGAAIGKEFGVDSATGFAMLTDGTLNAKDAVVGLLKAMKELEHGPIGTATKAQMGTIKGLESTVRSLKENLFFAMGSDSTDTSSVKGINDFKGALGNVIAYFNVLSDTGQRFAHAVEGVFGGLLTAVFGPLAGPSGMGLIESVMGKITTYLESVDWTATFTSLRDTIMTVGKVLYTVGSVFVSIWDGAMDALTPVFSIISSIWSSMSGGGTGALPVLKALGYAFGFLVVGINMAAIAALAFFFPITSIAIGIAYIGSLLAQVDWGYAWEQIVGTWTAVADWFKGLWKEAVDWGGNLIDGLVQGIKNKAGAVWDAITGVVGDIKLAFTGPTQIHSPSGLFEDYGDFLSQGLVRGVEGGQNDVNSAISNMAEASPSTGASGGRAVTVNFTEGAIHISGVAADAGELARKLMDTIASQLAGALESMAIEGGAT